MGSFRCGQVADFLSDLDRPSFGTLRGGGRSLDETVSFVIQLGPAGAALRDADDALRSKVAIEVRSALEPYSDGSGVRMPAAAWIVSARNPG